ncbi:uncharacterized protein SPPG_08277 [Spizellomyces punctatus DAOM BR117]|uniref:C3H1-type domain-containing protein n=1 Tax=Spizellomyces punctatus (strain DAOM BR117) TaxID=645134 RepID=A0A0L0H6L9_SPIPD|nr:uncharacterized protein SPPG_08277 [Spizellomyces punctatus DAOM BR117]KNC96378.1 hypothetical protein SPPG_08277 [Spizellomyces punctatus DAOM BR117]|eukprot:XP_016604418.1 hypothetical protein SPPG_08277 [Spizellomyces punctatus DAOM BR117]
MAQSQSSGSGHPHGYGPPPTYSARSGPRHRDRQQESPRHSSQDNRYAPYQRTSVSAQPNTAPQYQQEYPQQHAYQYSQQYAPQFSQQYLPFNQQQLFIQQQQLYLQQQQQQQQQMFGFSVPMGLNAMEQMNSWESIMGAFANGVSNVPTVHTVPTVPTVTYDYQNAPPPAVPDRRFRCDTCEKSFDARSQYITHNQTHVKCSECDFEASKKTVRLHEEEVHAMIDGVKKTFVSLEAPEDIEKWIAERKKRYPTDENIRKKQQEEEERIARGEVIRGEKGGPRGRGRGRGHEGTHTSSSTKPPKEENVLGMISAYASDDDAISSSSTSEAEGQRENDAEPRKQAKRPIRLCKYFVRGKCLKGDECTFRHEKPEAKPKKPRSTAPIVQQKRRPLLKMLLEADIRKEKNIILQCIRHIVQQNFFQDTNH